MTSTSGRTGEEQRAGGGHSPTNVWSEQRVGPSLACLFLSASLLLTYSHTPLTPFNPPHATLYTTIDNRIRSSILDQHVEMGEEELDIARGAALLSLGDGGDDGGGGGGDSARRFGAPDVSPGATTRGLRETRTSVAQAALENACESLGFLTTASSAAGQHGGAEIHAKTRIDLTELHFGKKDDAVGNALLGLAQARVASGVMQPRDVEMLTKLKRTVGNDGLRRHLRV